MKYWVSPKCNEKIVLLKNNLYAYHFLKMVLAKNSMVDALYLKIHQTCYVISTETTLASSFMSSLVWYSTEDDKT